MKKVFLSLLIVLMSWALVVSCDSNVNAVSNETVTVNFAASSTRSLSSSTSFVGVNDSSLTWFYKATPKEGAQFTHGAQSAWTLLGSLSNNIELSQGLWTFSLQARKGYSEGIEGIIIYQGATESEVLIRKQSTPVSVEIEVSPAIFGTGKIVFSNVEIEGIKTSETHRANKAVIGEQTFDLTDGSYTLNSIAAGNYSITVSYEVDDIVYGSETIDVTVFSGSTVTISGKISESSQSVTFNPSLNEEVATFPKQLSVDINTEDGTVSVSESKTIENGDLKVTYPVGTVITNANADATTNTADAETGFKYVSDTPSSSGITVSASESVAQYELTLNVAEDNNVLLTVEKIIEKDLFITKVLHDGNELAKTPAPEGEPAREYYSYNEENGKLTLYLFHASPIDIITLDTSLLPENARIVMNLQELKDAINGMHDGDYIAFGANIVQDEVDTSSGQITPTKASDAEGEVNATIDLNGFVFDGQIGGWVFSDTEGFKLNIIGTDKVSAGYYEHATGHHMVKAHAVNLYFNDALGTMTIKDGMFVCNNAVLANGNGNLVVDNGEFVADDGIILSTYNKGTTVINDGKFVTKKKNATFVDLELNYRSTSYQEVIINDGTFVMEASNCAGFVIDVSNCLNSEDKYGSITINGGKFTFAENSELVVALSWTGDPKVVKDSSLNNDAYKEIAKNSVIIKGGTFNLDPTDYVAEGYTAVANSNGTWTVKQVTTN